MIVITATFPDGTTEDTAVDAIITEGFQAPAVITEHPVETGANVADHIRPEAQQLRLELVVSNTSPQPGLVNVADSAEATYDQLIAWRDAGALLRVPTTLGPRASYGILAVNATRDAKTGGPVGKTGGLRISLALKEVRLVANKLTRVVVSKDKRRGGKTKTGTQPTKPLDKEPTSAAYSLGGAKLTGALAAYAKATGQ